MGMESGMPMEVTERKPFTIYNIVSCLEEYISQHRSCRDTDDRWFACFLEAEILPRARRIRSGGLNETERQLSRDFRLSEIEKEKADKQREIDRLDVEAKKLAAA